METVVLDACALIAYIRKEEGAIIVEGYLKDSTKRILMHAVNFYEVYYDYLKRQPDTAFLLYDLLKGSGIKLYNQMDKRIIEEGAALKIYYKVSLADSIALGLASKLNATLLTAGRHEFEEIAREKVVKVRFIR